MSESFLIWVAFLPGLIAALSAAFLKRYPRVMRSIAALATGISAVACVWLLVRVESAPVEVKYSWIPTWNLHFGLRADALSAFVAAVVSVLGFVDVLYSFGYTDPDEAGSAFYGWMCLFISAMVSVVLATDLIQFYFLWELMLIPSTALMVYWGSGSKPEATGFKYFIVTHVGAVMILVAILWILNATGTSDLYAVGQKLAGVSRSSLIAMASLLAAGFAVKMAIVPFHIWLPDAHSEAPLPVSVLLSAVMMDMGIYGLLRFLFTIFPRDILIAVSPYIMVLGVISQWYGGIEALGQTQMKRIAAYSTISQMGYVFFGIGSMTFLGVSGSTFHILSHGLAKALLFMTVGSVIHVTGAHDVDEVGGLGKSMPVSALFGIVAALSLAGAPPFAPFQSEWRIFAGGFETGRFVLAAISVSCSVLTAFYALKLVIRVFFGPQHQAAPGEAPRAMLGAMGVLAVLSVAAGVFPAQLSRLVDAATKVLGL